MREWSGGAPLARLGIFQRPIHAPPRPLALRPRDALRVTRRRRLRPREQRREQVVVRREPLPRAEERAQCRLLAPPVRRRIGRRGGFSATGQHFPPREDSVSPPVASIPGHAPTRLAHGPPRLCGLHLRPDGRGTHAGRAAVGAVYAEQRPLPGLGWRQHGPGPTLVNEPDSMVMAKPQQKALSGPSSHAACTPGWAGVNQWAECSRAAQRPHTGCQLPAAARAMLL